MSAPELSSTADQLLDCVQNDPEIAQPLFKFLRDVVDPNGDPARFGIADAVMRRLVVMTPQFEEWYKEQVVA